MVAVAARALDAIGVDAAITGRAFDVRAAGLASAGRAIARERYARRRHQRTMPAPVALRGEGLHVLDASGFMARDVLDGSALGSIARFGRTGVDVVTGKARSSRTVGRTSHGAARALVARDVARFTLTE